MALGVEMTQRELRDQTTHGSGSCIRDGEERTDRDAPSALRLLRDGRVRAAGCSTARSPALGHARDEEAGCRWLGRDGRRMRRRGGPPGDDVTGSRGLSMSSLGIASGCLIGPIASWVSARAEAVARGGGATGRHEGEGWTRYEMREREEATRDVFSDFGRRTATTAAACRSAGVQACGGGSWSQVRLPQPPRAASGCGQTKPPAKCRVQGRHVFRCTEYGPVATQSGATQHSGKCLRLGQL